MRLDSRWPLCFLAVLLGMTPYTPDSYLNSAKKNIAVANKITLLRRCLRDFPQDPRSRVARDQLITLLSGSNRSGEALQEYRKKLALRKPTGEPDLPFLEFLMNAGHFNEVLCQTALAPHNGQDFLFDEQLFGFRVQAFLAQGQYRKARYAVDQWLGMYAKQGLGNNRFSSSVENFHRVRRCLATLERTQGPTGKALFTASVPDSLKHWSRRQNVPIVFFQLVPADPARQAHGVQFLGHYRTEAGFRRLVDDMNRGFDYLSGNSFSLSFNSLQTLYVKDNDLDPGNSRVNLLASRVYIHTIPPLYSLAGRAFVVVVDYRTPSNDEAAYGGDGLMHIAAAKLHTMTLMHEILHSLGATHQEWDSLVRQGYLFDPKDRGLMTFDKGELRDLGLEEKNRVLLDWPHVAALHLDNETAELSTLPFCLPPTL